MASYKLTEVKLTGIHLHETKHETKHQNIVSETTSMEGCDVVTQFGCMHVVVQGDSRKPAILTYHDIGLNSTTCFQNFFNSIDMQPILKQFCVYHVNAPGQQYNALTLSSCHTYPTMDQLADMLISVMDKYKLSRFIGFGVGAGANILTRFALSYPDKVDALVLINCCDGEAKWKEWLYQKWNTWYLKCGQMTRTIEEYLLWHWIGMNTILSNPDLVCEFLDGLKHTNPCNLAYFINAFVGRTDLGLVRKLGINRTKETRNVSCKTLLITGDNSPHVRSTSEMNERMDPTCTTLVKFASGGTVLEEVPAKVSEAFLFFLQSLGYVPCLRSKRVRQIFSNVRIAYPTD